MGVKNCQNHPYVINEWPLNQPLEEHNGLHICKDIIELSLFRFSENFNSGNRYKLAEAIQW